MTRSTLALFSLCMAVSVTPAVCAGGEASSSGSASFDAVFHSHTWCPATVEECYGTGVPFEARIEFTQTSPESIDLSLADVTIQWVSHQMDFLEIHADSAWDTTSVELEQEDGRVRVRLVSLEPTGVRMSAGQMLCECVFLPERPGRLPYWVSSVELKDLDNDVVFPDTTAGSLGGDFCFKLGDFTGDAFGGYDWLQCPDRDIDVFDLNILSIHYGLTETDSLFDCRTDIGPTFTGWIHGVPVPDGVIDYDDVSIFAEAYAYQLGRQGSAGTRIAGAEGDWYSLRAAVVQALASGSPDRGKGDLTQTVHFTFSPQETTVTEGDSLWIDVRVSGLYDDLKTYQLIIQFNPSILEVVGLSQGAVFFNTPYDTFFRNRSEADSIDVMDSILGAGLTVSEPGTIVRIRLRTIGYGNSMLRFAGGRAAGVAGLPLPRSFTDGAIHVLQDLTDTAEPGLPAFGGARLIATPNPADGSCVLSFSSPEDQKVRVSEVDIYDVQGRLVRRWALENESTHSLSIEWDGRDHAGSRMSPGVYFAVLKGGSTRYETKVILAN